MDTDHVEGLGSLDPDSRTATPETTMKEAFVAVMGRTGSSKSTLVQLLTGRTVTTGGLKACMIVYRLHCAVSIFGTNSDHD